MVSTPASVCVFCGSRDGGSPAYAAAARQLGTAMAAEGWRLVYGAGDVGLMGAVAQAAQEGGGATFGVIPVHLMAREAARRDLGRLVITENMHERKKVMFMNSDAIVVLPGGAGSLDEFFEVVTWRQLGLHAKPIYLLNTEGYWDPLIQLFDHVVTHGFAEPQMRGYFTSLATVDELLEALRADLSTASARSE